MSVTFLPGTVSLLVASHQFPPQLLSNTQLISALKELSGHRYAKAARIAPYLGIEQRHFSRSIKKAVSRPSPSNSELTEQTVRSLVNQTRLTLSDIDYLIGHTTTPDTQLPPSIAGWLKNSDIQVRLWSFGRPVQALQIHCKSRFHELLCWANP